MEQRSTSSRRAWRNATCLFATLTAVALACDQVAKVAAVTLLAEGKPVTVVPFFNLRLGHNTGVSFGLFSETLRDTPLLVASFGVIVVLILGWMALRARRTIETAAFALVGGGALGNIADRVRIGAVVDYIDLYYGNWHWPTFNLADVFISFGVVVLLATSIFGKKTSTSRA